MLNKSSLIFTLALLLVNLFACKINDVDTNTVDFSYTYETANTLKFTAIVTGYYDIIEWTIGTESTSYVNTITHFFPVKGTYYVTLKLKTGDQVNSISKQVIIEQDAEETPSVITWSDEFEGNSLNTAIWNVETGITVNEELQVYTESGNHSVSNGVLTIVCKKVNNNGVYGSYTSARLKTSPKKLFKYGRIEARLKLPKGKGTWPAFWMLGENINSGTVWPTCGEIDIMEYVGFDPYWIQASLHSSDFYGENSKHGRFQLSPSNDEAQWHTYGVIWKTNTISFYIDDYTKPYYTCNAPTQKTDQNWPYDKNFFVILNLAFGGVWGGAKGIDLTLDNITYQVDWLRYYTN